ncbi:MAG: TldD/PmbA family protein, partial [Candidatus Eisenbacteria bacterium]|nr:TldD/PmbA family protein [Candidatus Eisenbacteria bacterium]
PSVEGTALATPAPPAPLSREERLEATMAELVRDLERSAPYASAFYVETAGAAAQANRGERTANRQPGTLGVVFQAFDGSVFHEASTDRIDDDSLRRVARELKAGLPRPARGARTIDPGPSLTVQRSSPRIEAPESMELGAFRDRAVSILDHLHESDSRIRSANVNLSYSQVQKIFVNRTRRIRQDLLYTNVFVFAFAADGDANARTFYGNRQMAGFEAARLDGDRLQEFLSVLDDLMRAERITPGTYDVITEPEVTGLLAHESFGHGVECDQFVKGRAKAAHYLDKRVAPDWVSIWDDPTRFDANGSYYFDDEGMEARPTQIVRDGIFVQPLTDLFSSGATGIRRTGNGRRQSFGNKAYARMSNTFFGPGDMAPGEMLASLEHGIHLAGFQSGIEDPHGWGIQFTCNRGYEIKNGRRTGRVFSPVGVTGYVPDILNSISQVGNMVRLHPGTCGKGYKEYVPVAAGGPHLRFRAPLA